MICRKLLLFVSAQECVVGISGLQWASAIKTRAKTESLSVLSCARGCTRAHSLAATAMKDASASVTLLATGFILLIACTTSVCAHDVAPPDNSLADAPMR